jgi:hypothetical protein
MVVIDATMLLLLLRPESAASPNPDGAPVDRIKDRIDYLVARLEKSKDKLIIPTPALRVRWERVMS